MSETGRLAEFRCRIDLILRGRVLQFRESTHLHTVRLITPGWLQKEGRFSGYRMACASRPEQFG